MKKSFYLSALSIAIAIIAGCAADHEIPTAQSPPVPPSRVTAPASMLAPCAECGAVTVKRDVVSGLLGSTQPVILDGKRIAWLKSGEKFTFYLPAGRYLLATACHVAWGCNIPRIVITVVAGKQQTFRLVTGANMSNSLGIVPELQE